MLHFFCVVAGLFGRVTAHICIFQLYSFQPSDRETTPNPPPHHLYKQPALRTDASPRQTLLLPHTQTHSPRPTDLALETNTINKQTNNPAYDILTTHTHISIHIYTHKCYITNQKTKKTKKKNTYCKFSLRKAAHMKLYHTHTQHSLLLIRTRSIKPIYRDTTHTHIHTHVYVPFVAPPSTPAPASKLSIKVDNTKPFRGHAAGTD